MGEVGCCGRVRAAVTCRCHRAADRQEEGPEERAEEEEQQEQDEPAQEQQEVEPAARRERLVCEALHDDGET